MSLSMTDNILCWNIFTADKKKTSTIFKRRYLYFTFKDNNKREQTEGMRTSANNESDIRKYKKKSHNQQKRRE
jgi:hypothetical protein